MTFIPFGSLRIAEVVVCFNKINIWICIHRNEWEILSKRLFSQNYSMTGRKIGKSDHIDYWTSLSPNKSSPVTLAVANSGNTTTFLRNCSLRCCGLWSRRLWRWILRRRGLWSCRPIFWLDGHSTARTGILSFKPNTMEKLIPDYYPMGKLTKVWYNWCGTCAKMEDSLRLHLLTNF